MPANTPVNTKVLQQQRQLIEELKLAAQRQKQQPSEQPQQSSKPEMKKQEVKNLEVKAEDVLKATDSQDKNAFLGAIMSLIAIQQANLQQAFTGLKEFAGKLAQAIQPSRVPAPQLIASQPKPAAKESVVFAPTTTPDPREEKLLQLTQEVAGLMQQFMASAQKATGILTNALSSLPQLTKSITTGIAQMVTARALLKQDRNLALKDIPQEHHEGAQEVYTHIADHPEASERSRQFFDSTGEIFQYAQDMYEKMQELQSTADQVQASKRIPSLDPTSIDAIIVSLSTLHGLNLNEPSGNTLQRLKEAITQSKTVRDAYQEQQSQSSPFNMVPTPVGFH